ncbi:hypothetical protein [Thalassococcus sp. S3]|uniref:hypothetical protein n=1 Tax=Thalassococcus sp. S3 TaxID=2017482 RepID=UPI001024608F|nr:hypothetical protein [Thalassococcus sp. S3]QBF31338.1 hypothetical protein CFI11_08915 [Thalassococcus sp. S3]
MDNKTGSLSCAITCWLVAALGGAALAIGLMVVADWLFIQGVFAGGVVFVVAGLLLSWLLCKPLPAPGSVTIAPPAPAAEKPAPEVKTAAAPAAAAPAPAVKPSTPLAGEAELAERKGAWKYEAEAAPAAEAMAETPADPEPETATDEAADEKKPETLAAPRDGGPDDLKLLKGVGPKLEETLHELGFYHFDQIAAWTDAEVAWVDTRLKFKGRIERDGWIEQAKILADGGETEFSARKK